MTPLRGDLDEPGSLSRLAGIAHRVVHLAPPDAERRKDGETDPRTKNLMRALRKRTPPQSLVYASTTGVYGNCRGEHVDETRTVHPHTPRAMRRVDAEAWVRLFGRSSGAVATILRVPGIYAQDREGGTPRERLLKRTPVLQTQDDVYTNHIHANDLARACILALWRGKPQRVVNVARSEADTSLPLMLLSFMNESRRLDNTRMKQELRLKLKYPHVRDGLAPQKQLL
ncbi:MAG: hypothetical protein RLZ63_325 [Pseudomonadota bacterium]